MPLTRVFSSQRLLCFPGSTGTRACTFSPAFFVCSVIVTDVTEILVRARGLLAAAPRAGWRAAFLPLVVRRGLPTAAAGEGVDGHLIVCVDGSNCVAPPPAIQHVCVLRHLGAIHEVFRNNVYYHFGGEAEEKSAMKYVPGLESVGSRAFICRIISDGFISPISGNLSSSNTLAQ